MTAITVTAQHIAAGVREDCENCPIALAILEAFPGVGYVAVGPGTCTIAPADGPTGATDVDLPESALNFIWDFDDGGHPKPFTFTLDYPAATP